MANAAFYRPRTDFRDFAGEAVAPYGDVVEAAAFPGHQLRFRNHRWADRIGLGALDDAGWIDHFGRFRPLEGGMPAPIALRYHGHQFRSYNPDIGDGRGFLFAQVLDDRDRLLDLATKGSGQTPWSRFGDGRLTLKGAVREVLATEMLEALGVYTSKTFSIIETGEALERNDEPSPARSAVLVRLGHSHVRFGSFQRLAFEQDQDALAALVDYCVRQFDPDLADLATNEKAVALFERVLRRSARLVARWMAAGFVHGVLNTDNMNVTGESFDYGPWRFAPTLDPSFTAAYFDQTGLYAFGRQPEAVLWNLTRFGGTLVPLADEAALNGVLQAYPAVFEAALTEAVFARLGLARSDDPASDFAAVLALMQWMENERPPFERVYFDWFGGAASADRRVDSPLRGLYEESGFADVAAQLEARQPDRPERLRHAYFTRAEPRAMLIDQMEALWAPIAENDDWKPFEAAITDIREMGAAYGFDASRYDAAPFSDVDRPSGTAPRSD